MKTSKTETDSRTVASEVDSEISRMASAQAHGMLTGAHIPQSGIDRLCVLANDIQKLAVDEFEGDTSSAARELETRIGGLKNLKSYTDCLLVGNRKFGL